MAKRSQVLRIPQKKYTEETVENVPDLGLPHENLIPTYRDSAAGGGADAAAEAGDEVNNGRAAEAPDSNASAAVSRGDREGIGAVLEVQARPGTTTGDSGDTGATGYTGITGRSATVAPGAADDAPGSSSLALKGRTRDVWNYFCRAVKDQQGEGNRVRTSRRQIQRESGIGSLNTIDTAIATLQGRGWLRVHPLPGSNEGYEYEVLLDRAGAAGTEAPMFIAETLQRAAGVIKREGETLTPDHLNKWSRVAHQINRLVDEFK
jgi:hypothetical protein